MLCCVLETGDGTQSSGTQVSAGMVHARLGVFFPHRLDAVRQEIRLVAASPPAQGAVWLTSPVQPATDHMSLEPTASAICVLLVDMSQSNAWQPPNTGALVWEWVAPTWMSFVDSISQNSTCHGYAATAVGCTSGAGHSGAAQQNFGQSSS